MDDFLKKLVEEKIKKTKLKDILEELLTQAIKGIYDIHAAELIHRDIKDANMFVNEIGPGNYILKIGD